MKKMKRRLLILPLMALVAFALAGCDQVGDVLPLPVGPPKLEVTPNNGPFVPSDLDANEQALLVAKQSLSTGEGTKYFGQLNAVNSLLERLGEEMPPGPGVPMAPPRAALEGRLSAQRALDLSRPAPVTIIGDINATVDGITFTGESSINEERNLVTAQIQGVSADGTNLNIEQTYSRNPDDFTYSIQVSGVLAENGVKMSYEIVSNYDSDGNGASTLDFKILDSTDKTGYNAQLIITENGLSVLGAEAVTRTDGFWTIANFNVSLDNAGRVTAGVFELEASNDYTGSFILRVDGSADGAVKNADGNVIANLSVNPLGDTTITYADGTGQNIIVL